MFCTRWMERVGVSRTRFERTTYMCIFACFCSHVGSQKGAIEFLYSYNLSIIASRRCCEVRSEVLAFWVRAQKAHIQVEFDNLTVRRDDRHSLKQDHYSSETVAMASRYHPGRLRDGRY